MNKISRSALTLTELLVASIMIAIVMVAVASFGSNIKGMQSATGRATLTGLTTTSALARLRADTEAAIGDSSSLGVVSSKSAANGQLCFRHEVVAPPTPDNYADDRWVCYTHAGGYDIYRCENLVAPVTDCTAGTATFFFTIPTPSPATASFFNVDMTGGTFQHVEITLTGRKDAGTASDPMKNPEKSMTTRISPMSHSRQ